MIPEAQTLLSRPEVPSRQLATAVAKKSIRKLDFYYGGFQALKDV